MLPSLSQKYVRSVSVHKQNAYDVNITKAATRSVKRLFISLSHNQISSMPTLTPASATDMASLQILATPRQITCKSTSIMQKGNNSKIQLTQVCHLCYVWHAFSSLCFVLHGRLT